MEIQTKWTSDHNFAFETDGVTLLSSPSAPKKHKISPTPYEWFLFSLAGSTGMEMLKHFEAHHTTFSSLSINVKGNLVPKYNTKVFSAIDLEISCETECGSDRILNAVEYSQFLSSGISAMISQSLPVRWLLVVNKAVVGEGIAKFAEPNESYY